MPGSEYAEDRRIGGVDGFAMQEAHGIDYEVPNHQRRGNDGGHQEDDPAVDIRLLQAPLKQCLAISPEILCPLEHDAPL